jgi:two-component system chemotaxis response regulator CheB
LVRLVAHLPEDLDAAILVMMLQTRESLPTLPMILRRECALAVTAAVDGAAFAYGQIRVAPAGAQLRVSKQAMTVEPGPASIDAFLRSAAENCGPHAIGVVLSGELADGANGLAAIRRAGGLAMVQAPDDAFAPSMPTAALAGADPQHVLPAEGIGRAIGQACRPARTRTARKAHRA